MAKKQAAKPPLALKVVPIGNSRGIRIPREILTKYRIGDALLAEELEEGWLLRAPGDGRTTWEETYRQAQAEKEDWSDWDATIADGLHLRTPASRDRGGSDSYREQGAPWQAR